MHFRPICDQRMSTFTPLVGAQGTCTSSTSDAGPDRVRHDRGDVDDDAAVLTHGQFAGPEDARVAHSAVQTPELGERDVGELAVVLGAGRVGAHGDGMASLVVV